MYSPSAIVNAAIFRKISRQSVPATGSGQQFPPARGLSVALSNGWVDAKKKKQLQAPRILFCPADVSPAKTDRRKMKRPPRL